MKKNFVFLCFFTVLAVFTLSINTGAAQEIDISNLTEEQQTQLLIQLLQMQGTGNTTVPTVAPTPTSTPIPDLNSNPYESMDNDQLRLLLIQMLLQQQGSYETSQNIDEILSTTSILPTMESTPETKKHTIYELKKLTIEALPGYMFVQPTTQTESDNNPSGGKTPEPEFDEDGCPPGYYYECRTIHGINPATDKFEDKTYCVCWKSKK